MSMLAERKRKQKWVILDRNVNKTNNWSKDTNKFGHKMLERMGWKEGKGLGRNEDGLTDYVKVAYKNNSKGVGFKDSVEWSAQQDNFNTLLGELSNSNSNDAVENKQQEMKSLEEKSQNSRARVHYKKFTRGKDLSRYSQKDLANIFGKKKLNEKQEEDVMHEQDDTSKSKELLTITGGSMVDYFKNKIAANFDKSKTSEDLNDSENDQVSYGFGFNSQTVNNARSSNVTESNLCELNVTVKSKKSKDKRKHSKEPKNMFVSYVADENDVNVISKKRKGGDTLESSEEIIHTPSKKKIKFDDPKRKKKKKHNIDSNCAIDNPTFNVSSEVELNESSGQEVKRKKTKKSKGLDNPALNDSSFDAQLQETEDGNKILGDLESTNTSQDFEVKRKKKKKKSKGLDNPALNLNDSIPELVETRSQTIENGDEDFKNGKDNSEKESSQNYEVQRKKKKSKGLDNPALNVNESSSSFVESQKNKSFQNGIENTALEISDCDIMLNVTDEPVTPIIDKSTPRNKSKNVRFSKTNQEYIISARSSGDIDKRNELYDINTKVIQDGLRDLKKQKNFSSTNPGFDIKSVDKIDFCDDGFSKSPRNFIKTGIDKRGFDVKAQNVEESVYSLTKTIDSYQAEVENGINESKMKKTVQEDFMVGEFYGSDGENEVHKEGVKLRFKYAMINKKQPVWARRNDVSATFAKKSYKHLIRGDIILGFKKTNLHKIDGYASKLK